MLKLLSPFGKRSFFLNPYHDDSKGIDEFAFTEAREDPVTAHRTTKAFLDHPASPDVYVLTPFRAFLSPLPFFPGPLKDHDATGTVKTRIDNIVKD